MGKQRAGASIDLLPVLLPLIDDDAVAAVVVAAATVSSSNNQDIHCYDAPS
ncbi:MAG: hypothetical protein M3093_04120 [Thermoproteota archaeon]|nr:hypothetical protein [Thermoproteota archaeon]